MGVGPGLGFWLAVGAGGERASGYEAVPEAPYV